MLPVVNVAQMRGWFAGKLHVLERRYSPEVLAYVVGVLVALGTSASTDMSTKSVVLAYQDATETGDFAGFQRIGDWVLWVDAVFPDSIASERFVVESFGRMSYLSCHRILRGQWRLYEELADELPSLAVSVRSALV
jgi:hypothetical protein